MAGSFANDPIDVGGLPRLDEADFVRVNPRYALPSIIGSVIGAVIALIVSSLIATQVERPFVPIMIGAAIAVISLTSAVVTLAERRVAAYLLREHDVSFRSGVFSRQIATIPLARVQHVSVNRGAIERSLGLATLAVNSAGPDLAIPGLSPDEAEQLKLFIIEHSDATDDSATASNGGARTHSTADAVPAPPPPPHGQPLPPPSS